MNTHDAPRGPWLVGSEFADHDPRMDVTIAFERDAVPVRTLRYRRDAIEAAIRATPDLLAACEAALANHERYPYRLLDHDVEVALRAAIAKARPASVNGGAP
jgi:hypothetical protein